MEVRQKSVADRAGLKAGDLIVSINGISAKTLELNSINGMINHKPGKKLNMVVDRKGEQIKLSFELADQI
ncbi:MAG TPA: PDZ domain-containing protein, partial [Chryseosolibacter sp.]